MGVYHGDHDGTEPDIHYRFLSFYAGSEAGGYIHSTDYPDDRNAGGGIFYEAVYGKYSFY